MSGSDVVKTTYCRAFRIQWTRNGHCYVASTVSGSLIGTYDAFESVWTTTTPCGPRVPDDVKARAMEVRP